MTTTMGDPTSLAATRVQAIRRIATPLMAAVSDWRYVPEGDPAERTAQTDAALFADLTATAVALARRLADAAGVAEDSDGDAARWTLAASAAEIVAAHFRATAKAPTVGDTDLLIGAAAAIDGPEGTPSDPPAGEPLTRIRQLRALAPIAGAVARFAFGRERDVLLAEVATRITARADAIARLLAPDPCPTADWHSLRLGVLEAATEIYADAHYAEMDRLLDMTEAERDEYVRLNGGQVPLSPVWDGFDQRMSLLTSLAERIDKAPSAGLGGTA